MSMKAARKSLLSLSSSTVLCLAVRAGHVSTRKKMMMTVIARINAISVNANGQETRPEIRDVNIKRWALGVLFPNAVIEQEHDHEQEQEERGRFSPSTP